jgi:AraC-like DNA-binding protein
MLGVGKRTFARVVEESIGISGKLWLRRLRIVKARHMLREGGEIKSVAKQLGFDDNASFANEFKKLIGVSPTFYIKSEQSRSIEFQSLNQPE